MAQDLMDAVCEQLADSVVGLVKRVEGAGSTLIGSGVLVSIEGKRGILTCGHVAALYDKRGEIGLARLTRKTQNRRIIYFDGARHIILHSSANDSGDDLWQEADCLDLAFTYLDPDVADSIATQSVFLNLEKNRERIEGGEPTTGHSIDVVFGVVEEFSGTPFIEDGKFVSPMRAMVYRGRMHTSEKALVHFQTIDDAPAKLPKHFGGLSGSGLWRIHFVDHGEGNFEITQRRLWGITFWQVDKENNTGAIIGQSWDRIEQALIPQVRNDVHIAASELGYNRAQPNHQL